MIKSAIALFAYYNALIEGRINPNGPTVVMDFANCINNLIENNFKESGLLIFANTKNVSSSASRIRNELLMKTHNSMIFSVEIMHPDKELDVCHNYDEKLGVLHIDKFETRPFAAYFVIVLDKFKDFPFLTSKIIRSPSWNPKAKFIILLLNFEKVKTNIQVVESMLSCLYKYNVIDVLVLVPEEGQLRNAIVYSWRPYDPPEYCGYYNETAKNRVYIENKCEKGVLIKNDTVKDRIPNNMQNCALQIIALERAPFVSRDDYMANLEMVFVTELVGRYNFTTNYEIVNTPRGERESDGQWTGALKALTEKRGQILLGGIFPDDDVHEDFDCSLPYMADSYTWVVPRADKSPPWTALSSIFHKIVWYSLIAGFSLCAVFWRILGQLSKDTRYNQSLHHCFLNSWICTVGYCAYMRPHTHSLRVFFCFFNIYCLIIITAYQTQLINVLKTPSFEYQIQNREDMVQSDLEFGGFEELHDLFSEVTDPMDRYISEKWTHVTDISSAMLDVTVHRNFSFLCSRIELGYVSAVAPELSDSFGNYKYYAFDSSMFTVPLEMVALRGYAFMKKFSETLSLFKQSGINVATVKRFSYLNTLRRASLLRTLLKKKSDVNALSLRHLESGFVILTFGYISGIIILLLEIMINNKYINQKLMSLKKKVM